MITAFFLTSESIFVALRSSLDAMPCILFLFLFLSFSLLFLFGYALPQCLACVMIDVCYMAMAVFLSLGF